MALQLDIYMQKKKFLSKDQIKIDHRSKNKMQNYKTPRR